MNSAYMRFSSQPEPHPKAFQVKRPTHNGSELSLIKKPKSIRDEALDNVPQKLVFPTVSAKQQPTSRRALLRRCWAELLLDDITLAPLVAQPQFVPVRRFACIAVVFQGVACNPGATTSSEKVVAKEILPGVL